MTKKERRQAYENQLRAEIRGLPAERAPVCGNCCNWHQHYVQRPGIYGEVRFVNTSYGHCTRPRLKDRKAYDGCENFKDAGTRVAENASYCIERGWRFSAPRYGGNGYEMLSKRIRNVDL